VVEYSKQEPEELFDALPILVITTLNTGLTDFAAATTDQIIRFYFSVSTQTDSYHREKIPSEQADLVGVYLGDARFESRFRHQLSEVLAESSSPSTKM
jgi:hypothetical protein